MKGFAQFSMLKRPGTSEEMARLILFLASDACPYLVGQNILADGGLIDYRAVSYLPGI